SVDELALLLRPIFGRSGRRLSNVHQVAHLRNHTTHCPVVRLFHALPQPAQAQCFDCALLVFFVADGALLPSDPDFIRQSKPPAIRPDAGAAPPPGSAAAKVPTPWPSRYLPGC